MQCGQNRGQNVLFIDANGEANIVSSGIKRERMGRAIEAAALELKSDGWKKPAGKLPLACIRESAALKNGGMRRRDLRGLLHQGHEPLADRVENRPEPRACHVLLV